jgi:CBS domain-containing protein
MNIRKYFESIPDPEINVAIVGIYKGNWISTKGLETKEVAVKNMSKNRFDILPVVEKDGSINRCLKTIEWGNYDDDNIDIHTIALEDRMYFLTTIYDAIAMFVKRDRKYFFLDNHDEIVGLITIANLNSKDVYLYLYNLIIQLEHFMGNFIYNHGIQDTTLISFFEKTSKDQKAKSILIKFRKDDENALDNRFTEYLYLSNYKEILNHFELNKWIGLTKEALTDKLDRIVDLRNIVAHPNKSLISKKHTISNLYEAMKDIHQLIDKLKSNI